MRLRGQVLAVPGLYGRRRTGPIRCMVCVGGTGPVLSVFVQNQTKRKHLKQLVGIRKALLTAAWDLYMSFAKRHGFART